MCSFVAVPYLGFKYSVNVAILPPPLVPLRSLYRCLLLILCNARLSGVYACVFQQVRSCTKDQIVARLREDRKLAAKFYRIAAVSIAARLAEISPLDVYL